MTTTTTPTTTDRKRGRAGVAALSLAAGVILGITGTVLAAVDDDAARPTVQRLAVVQASSHDRDDESACRLVPADAAERCLAEQAESACTLLTADAAERCITDRATQG